MPAIQFDLPTTVFLVWTGLLLPGMALISWQHLRAGKPLAPRGVRLRLMFLVSLLSALLAIAAAQSQQILLPIRATALDLLLGVMIAAMLVMAAQSGWKKAKPAQRERLYLLYAPETRVEFGFTLLGGLCAGIGEELAYRAVLFSLVTRLTASLELALVICVVVFAAAHLAQGGRATVAVACFGILFHLLYQASGNLLLPMLVHTAYDLAFFTMLYWNPLKREPQPNTVEQASPVSEAPPATKAVE